MSIRTTQKRGLVKFSMFITVTLLFVSIIYFPMKQMIENRQKKIFQLTFILFIFELNSVLFHPFFYSCQLIMPNNKFQ